MKRNYYQGTHSRQGMALLPQSLMLQHNTTLGQRSKVPYPQTLQHSSCRQDIAFPLAMQFQLDSTIQCWQHTVPFEQNHLHTKRILDKVYQQGQQILVDNMLLVLLCTDWLAQVRQHNNIPQGKSNPSVLLCLLGSAIQEARHTQFYLLLLQCRTIHAGKARQFP
jgi:hypothetical protein